MLGVNRTTPLLIVGAALPRTGTTSTRLALERLGYSVFHATTNGPRMLSIWKDLAIADHAGNSERREELFQSFVEQLMSEGFDTTLDQPSCFVYRELMERYPDAKVLNTRRDSAQSWARSMVEMVYSLDLLLTKPPYNFSLEAVISPYGRWSKEQLGIRMDEVFKDGVPNATNLLEARSSVSYDTVERVYNEYQAAVESTVPAERLVRYNVKQGWGPLCDNFLPPGVECPLDEPFPNINSKEKGFLLHWKQQMQIRTTLHAVHPWLGGESISDCLLFLLENRWPVLAGFLTVLTCIVSIKWLRRADTFVTQSGVVGDTSNKK